MTYEYSKPIILMTAFVVVVYLGIVSGCQTSPKDSLEPPPQSQQTQEVSADLKAMIDPVQKTLGDLSGQVGTLTQDVQSNAESLQTSTQEALNGFGQESKKESTATRDLLNSQLTETRNSVENFGMSANQLADRVKVMEAQVATFAEREETIRENYREALEAEGARLQAVYAASLATQNATWEQANQEMKRQYHVSMTLYAILVCLLLALWFEDAAETVPDKTWVPPLWIAFCVSLGLLGLCVVSLITGWWI